MLKCPVCGEHRARVLDTRSTRGGIRRRRHCFNGHLFWTLEASETITRITRRLDRHADQIDVKHERWKRDQAIVRMVRAGTSKALVAGRFKVAPTTVSYVLGKYAPELKRKVKRAG